MNVPLLPISGFVVERNKKVVEGRYWHLRVMWTWRSQGFSKVEQGHDRGKHMESNELIQERACRVGGEHDRASPVMPPSEPVREFVGVNRASPVMPTPIRQQLSKSLVFRIAIVR